jgi:predicted ATPase
MKDRDGIEDVYEHECEALRTMSPDEIKAFLDDTAKTMVNMYEEHIESIRESMGKDNGES